MKELTKAELQVMQYLWKLEKGFLKDIVDQFPDPKPAPTTVSTIIRILVRKGFADYQAFGKAHRYYPTVKKEEYARASFNGMLKNFFGGSTGKFASFFTADNNLTVKELENIKSMIEHRIGEQKSGEDE
jgi:predicted transcriptional regulator